MAIISKQAKGSIVGKVLKITFEKPGVKYLEFELPSGDKCFCRGNAASGKNFNSLTEGAHVKLFGQWGVSNNPQYKWMKEQFNFSDYELLPTIEVVPRKTPEATRSSAKEAPTKNQEEVRGHIVRFRPFTSNYRIFLLRSIDGREFWCQGTIDPSITPYENNKVRLDGNWRKNPRHPEFGLQFYFTSYDIITPGKPEKVIRRPRTGNWTMTSTTTGDTVTERVAAHLKAIGALKMTYQFNKPKQNTISQHVLHQLNDRIIISTAEKKDFYFLTALLDRNVPDKKVQLFRSSHRDFKLKLLQCWKDAKTELEIAISNIGRTSLDWRHLRTISKKSDVFKSLKETIPGENGINQLLVCLKVIWDKYNLDMTYNINELVRGHVKENALKQYLIEIHGVKHKIANWALTNITGHWFVIDEPNIKPMIKKDLADSIPPGMEVSAENADTIFEHWFGKLNETNKEYERFSRDQFTANFPDFPLDACEYLPFIVTQHLWFYGKKIALSKSAVKAHWAISRESETIASIPTKPTTIITTPAWNTYKIDWQKVQSISDLVQLLPADIKTKKIWPAIPEELKEEIIKRARHLAASRNFAVPAEWDGSLKQALLLIDSGRLPNGFKIFLGL